MILFIMLSPCRAGIAAQLKLSLICFLRRTSDSAASRRKAYPLRCPMFAYVFMSAAFAALPYVSRLLLAAPEEGHDLGSGAIRVGAECGVGGSLGDVLLDRP